MYSWYYIYNNYIVRYWNGKVDKYAITVYVKFIKFLQMNFTLNSNTLQCTVYQLLLVHSISLVPVYIHNIQGINQLMYKNWSRRWWIVTRTNTKEKEQWKEFPGH